MTTSPICLKKRIPGWSGSVGHRPANQKFASLITGQGTCLGCGFGSWLGCIWKATNRCFSPSLSPSLPLSPLKQTKKQNKTKQKLYATINQVWFALFLTSPKFDHQRFLTSLNSPKSVHLFPIALFQPCPFASYTDHSNPFFYIPVHIITLKCWNASLDMSFPYVKIFKGTDTLSFIFYASQSSSHPAHLSVIVNFAQMTSQFLF